MGAVVPEDLPVTHNPATALEVERIGEGWLPALLAPDPDAAHRVIEFFTAHIRNPHTCKAYAWVRCLRGAAPTSPICTTSSRTTSLPTSKNCKAIAAASVKPYSQGLI